MKATLNSSGTVDCVVPTVDKALEERSRSDGGLGISVSLNGQNFSNSIPFQYKEGKGK